MRKDCITNLDELAEANLAAFYKMELHWRPHCQMNPPPPASSDSPQSWMKLFWILSNQVLVQILFSVLSSWQTKWKISMVPAYDRLEIISVGLKSGRCPIGGVMEVHGVWAQRPEFTDRRMDSGYEDGKTAVRVQSNEIQLHICWAYPPWWEGSWYFDETRSTMIRNSTCRWQRWHRAGKKKRGSAEGAVKPIMTIEQASAVLFGDAEIFFFGFRL